VFGGDHGEQEMSGQTEYPAWDGGQDRVLPAGAITDLGELVQELIVMPYGVGEHIIDGLGGVKGVGTSVLNEMAAGEVPRRPLADGWRVILWLPFFDDQRTLGGADEPDVEHEEIDAPERWRDADMAMGILLLGEPTIPIDLGFVIDERESFALPWFEYCRRYSLAPQYVVATWD
jgi:hypothetical protein